MFIPWILNLYPKGSGIGSGTCLSLYLFLDGSKSLPPNRKVYAKYKLRIRDLINSNHLENLGLFSLTSQNFIGSKPSFLFNRDRRQFSPKNLDEKPIEENLII
jgi:hypothetical protein